MGVVASLLYWTLTLTLALTVYALYLRVRRLESAVVASGRSAAKKAASSTAVINLPDNPPALHQWLNLAGGRAWPFVMRDLLAKLSATSSSSMIKGISLSEEPPEVLAVHHVEDSDAPKDADVLTADVEVVWRGQSDSERASAIVHLANETLACRFSLTYLRLTLRSYAWVTTPEGRGNGKPFSFVEGSLSPEAPPPIVTMAVTPISSKSSTSTAAAAAADVMLSAVQAAAETAVKSMATGWDARVMLSEASRGKADSQNEKDGDWQVEARRAGWVPRQPLSFLESAIAKEVGKAASEQATRAEETMQAVAQAFRDEATETANTVTETANAVRAAAAEKVSQAQKVFADGLGAAMRRRISANPK